jgi:hypothetical protein
MPRKTEAKNALPTDDAAGTSAAPWAIDHLKVDRRVMRILKEQGLRNVQGLIATRVSQIRGMGPATVATLGRALADRLSASDAMNVVGQDASAIIDGALKSAFQERAVLIRTPVTKRTARRKPVASPSVVSTPSGTPTGPITTIGTTGPSEEIAPDAAVKDATPVVTEDEAPAMDVSTTNDRAEQPNEDVESEKRRPHGWATRRIQLDPTHPDLEGVLGDRCEAKEVPSGPRKTRVTGGIVITEVLEDGRMLILCHDRYLLPIVTEACGRFEAVPEGRGWTSDHRTHHRILHVLRSDEAIERLREQNPVWNRVEPTHSTSRGSLHLRPYESSGKQYFEVRSHPYDEAMVKRLDVVCGTLGGKWSPVKRNWSLAAQHQAALLRAMEPDRAPLMSAPDEYAVPDRTYRDSGLEYASAFANKPDLDWYEAKGQIMLIDTPQGRIEIVRVEPRTWIARRPNGGSTAAGINALITQACGTMMGSQGNWHPPFAGRRFDPADAERIIATLKGEGADTPAPPGTGILV